MGERNRIGLFRLVEDGGCGYPALHVPCAAIALCPYDEKPREDGHVER